MSKIGEYLLERLENGEDYDDILSKGVDYENNRYQG